MTRRKAYGHDPEEMLEVAVLYDDEDAERIDLTPTAGSEEAQAAEIERAVLEESRPRRRKRNPVWLREVPDFSGANAFIALVRDPRDPVRKPRPPTGTPRDTAPHRTIAKTPMDLWAHEIEEHLKDGIPRTMNRIAVEMLDKTADIVFQTPFERGLWYLVERERVEFTNDAPIYFRIRRRRGA